MKQNNHHHNQPLVRMVKRTDLTRGKSILIRVLALLAAFVTGGLLIALLGKNPVAVYGQMVTGALMTPAALRETIRIAIPLLITSLGVALAFKMKFWNIGAEGQICLGAIAATYFALFYAEKIPQPFLFLVMFLAGAVFGGLWGLIPAYFKAKFNTNETLFTLMMNYVAVYIIQYLREGPWINPANTGFPQIARFDTAARLPKVFGVHIGWIVALVLVGVMYFYLNRTKQGYEISVVGESQPTAKYAGMNVGRVIMRTMFLSGALCGIAGMLQVTGADHTLVETVAGGVGFTAITVAWLGNLNPVAMLVTTFLFSILDKGSNSIQTVFAISNAAAEVLTGIILFFMLGCEFFIRYRLVWRRKEHRDHE